MSRALYFQCHSGISGDMTLAALIALGMPIDHLRAELSKLSLDHEFELEATAEEKMGISGTQVTVTQTADGGHGAHSHGHAHGHEHDHHHSHGSRDYQQIKQLIENAPYSKGVRDRALDMFRLVGEAEAKIHAMPLEKVHFHEVGAIDSIVDIVGAAIGLEYLQIETIVCDAVELGSGRVRCAHGEYPVPAPATSEILIGVPCQMGGLKGEATTPTGAAILKSNVDDFEPTGRFTPERIGYGIGHKNFEIPNVLRVMLGNYSAGEKPQAQAVSQVPKAANYEITTNIDDMSAEGFQPMLDRLFETGASDAFLTPIVMKKGRLAQSVTVLCRAEKLEALSDLLMSESSSIGVRIKPIWKRMLEREIRLVSTTYGDVHAKIVSLPAGGRRWKVEHDDIVDIANRTGQSYAALKAEIEREVANALRDD